MTRTLIQCDPACRRPRICEQGGAGASSRKSPRLAAQQAAAGPRQCRLQWRIVAALGPIPTSTMAAQLRSPFTGQGFLTSRVTVAPSATAPRQVTCMAKKKGVRMIVTLECTEARAAGATPSRYTTQKVGSSPRPAPRHATWQWDISSGLAGALRGTRWLHTPQTRPPPKPAACRPLQRQPSVLLV